MRRLATVWSHALLCLALAGSPAAAQQGLGEGPAEPGYLGAILDDRDEAGQGLRVLDVDQGGPAASGSLQAGDVIVAANGQVVRTAADFAAVIQQTSPGERLELQVERNGRSPLVGVRLGRRPAEGRRRFEFGRIPDETAVAGEDSAPGGRPRLGILAKMATPYDAERLGLPAATGVLVVEVVPGSPAEGSGLEPGAVIISAAGYPVRVPGDLATIVESLGVGGRLELEYYQQGRLQRRTLTLAAQPPPSTVHRLPVPPPSSGSGTPLADSQDATVAALQERIRELERRVEQLERELRGDAR